VIIPATPVEGPAITAPLVTTDLYVKVTGDAAGVVAQSDLDDATLLACEHCVRTFAYGTYTERLYVDRNGYVYPSACPIDVTQSTLIGGQTGGLRQGDSIQCGYFTPLPDLFVFTGFIDPQTDVVYTGGYQPYGATGGPTPGLPMKLARAICKVAWFNLHPVALQGVASGVKSMSVGGVSISGDLSSMVLMDSQLRSDLAGYRRMDAKGW
jgi:hypothetical protein